MEKKYHLTQDAFNEAQRMCDRYARLHKIDKKSPRYKKLLNRYLDGIAESTDPDWRPMKNNPQVSKRVVEAAYEDYYDLQYSFIAKKFGNSQKTKELMQRLESAVNNLNAIFLEVQMDLTTKHRNQKNSDFDMPKSATDSQKAETWFNQYKRMTSLSLIYAALYPMMVLTNKADIIAIMSETNAAKLSPEQLHKLENRIEFSKTLYEYLKPHFYNRINFRQIITGEASAKRMREPKK